LVTRYRPTSRKSLPDDPETVWTYLGLSRGTESAKTGASVRTRTNTVDRRVKWKPMGAGFVNSRQGRRLFFLLVKSNAEKTVFGALRLRAD
jgi:hypothetical protein